MQLSVSTDSKEKTMALGEALAPFFQSGDVVTLTGDLGAGKTTLSNGIGKGLGIKIDVISPTFNILRCYFDGRIPLYHIDAYRLEGQNIELGLDEAIEGDGLCLVEWPAFIAPLLPDARIAIEIRNRGGDNRELRFRFDEDAYPWLKTLLGEWR